MIKYVTRRRNRPTYGDSKHMTKNARTFGIAYKNSTTPICEKFDI
jgi:hypothetical protein